MTGRRSGDRPWSGRSTCSGTSGRADRCWRNIHRVVAGDGYSLPMRNVRDAAPLMREVLGESLREQRTAQGRTLREVSQNARVSLGYLSEIERGQKEASSELLAAICGALDVPLSIVLDDVSQRLASYESVALLRVVPVAAA